MATRGNEPIDQDQDQDQDDDFSFLKHGDIFSFFYFLCVSRFV